MEIKILNAHSFAPKTVTTTCPSCGRDGTFDVINAQVGASGYALMNDLGVYYDNEIFTLGQRMCPNPQCHLHIFTIVHHHGNDADILVKAYPPLRLNFNSQGIPHKIVETFKQAITCHTEECYVPAAIMIRRALEELCEDRGATGGNLKQRIQALQSKVILPKELFDAIDDLRLLGNDAAHVESKDYNQVGKEEVEAAIELTKEILKACYQLSDLVAKLAALKK